VPTLVHDGQVVRESTLICEYLDEVFSDTPLKPADALGKVRMRSFTKMVDEKIHDRCAVLTFSSSHRHSVARLGPEAVEEFIARTPDPDWRARKRDWIENGLESKEAVKSVRIHDAMLAEMEKALAGGAPFLTGETYSLADIGITPYVNRLHMFGMLEDWTKDRPGVRAWFDRIRARPSFKPAVDDWLPEQLWTDFSTNGAKAWPEVKRILEAA
jgi:glutathione S-transferase